MAEAKQDKRIIGIHAAMGGGTGMNRFEQQFPERTFDVGIAEQVRLLNTEMFVLSVPCNDSWNAIASLQGICSCGPPRTMFIR